MNKWPEKCCLCGLSIAENSSWKGGNNPAPLAEAGRCCDRCNAQVIKARQQMLADALMQGRRSR